MTHDIDKMTIEWEFLGSIEPPKVVHVYCAETVSKGVFYAQLTLRAHTKQVYILLCIYSSVFMYKYGNQYSCIFINIYVYSPHVYSSVLMYIHPYIVPMCVYKYSCIITNTMYIFQCCISTYFGGE